MKILSSLWFFASLAGATAAAGQSTVPDAPAASLAAREFAAVERFLDLNDAELDEVMQVIARIRAMTPEQRAALRDEIAAFRQLPEPQRQQLRRGWGQMPEELREGWREMMQSLSPEQHAAMRAKLQSLPPEERAEYRRKLVEEFLAQRASGAPAVSPKK